MRKVELSLEDFENVRWQKDYHPDRLVRRRMHMLFMLHKGYDQQTTADVLDITQKTVWKWLNTYFSDGYEALLVNHHKGSKTPLDEHIDLVKVAFTEKAPMTYSEASHEIEQLTGIKRGLTQTRKFLKDKLKFRRRKDQPLPGGGRNLDELDQAQVKFLRKTLRPLLKKAKQGKVTVLFCDAVHPVQGFHGGYSYGIKARCHQTPTGRHRVNLLSALNAVTLSLCTVAEEKYVTATTVVELFGLLREVYGKQEKIYLILDNARYQKCALATEAAKKLKIKLVYLPPYSPNLNLIERFWKFLKKKILTGKQYVGKVAFTEAIYEFMYEVNDGKYDSELVTLLTHNFQSIKKTIKRFTLSPA